VWGDPTVDLDLYLASAGCAYPPTGCLLAISDTSGGNTESISYGVGGGQTYRLWVDNFSPRTMSYTIYNTISGAPLAPVDVPGGSKELTIRKVKP
jgi:hypothetical protein